jgi:chromosome segregation ATPase
MKRSFDHSHFGLSTSDSRNGSTSSFFNRESSSQGQGGLPSRQGLRDMLLASMDLLLEDHFVTLESNHQSQIRRISHLERSAQDSSMALVQAQKDYTALESTVLQDREKAEHLSKELDNERSLRKAQAEESTSLISQLEKQLHSQRKTTCSLESRVNTLSKQLKESQSEIDRLEGEMTKGYTEMNGRLSNIGRLEKEGDEWKRRAEEAEFTVKALREEGVRMSRELEKKGKIIEELEKGRKFVTRV